jgi:hypothetical protein
MKSEPRRNILAGIGAALAAPATAGAATPATDAGPDAELITACREFEKLERLRLSYRGSEKYDPEEERKEDEAYAQISSQQAPLVEQLCRMRATTEAGHIARARSLLLWNRIGFDAAEDPTKYCSERMLAALLRDLVSTAPAAMFAPG